MALELQIISLHYSSLLLLKCGEKHHATTQNEDRQLTEPLLFKRWPLHLSSTLIIIHMPVNNLGRRELGNSLRSLRHSVLGQFSRQH